jgi:hypothetical protein
MRVYETCRSDAFSTTEYRPAGAIQCPAYLHEQQHQHGPKARLLVINTIFIIPALTVSGLGLRSSVTPAHMNLH